MFATPLEVETGEIVRRDGFSFIDVRPTGDPIGSDPEVVLRAESLTG